MRFIPVSRCALGSKIVLAGALICAVAGCGFHLAGAVGHLPAAMHHTCIHSGEPYGHLENLLRNAIRASGEQVSASCEDGDAVLAIMRHSTQSRLLAVNSSGQPQEYQLIYRVEFELRDAAGKVLLAPTRLKTQRLLAYSVNNELGTGSRRQSLVNDMQREVSRLILLRLQALDRQAVKPSAPATSQTNV